VADLVSEPMPSDVALICRNLRTMNGKKPIFVDRADSTFVLPLAAIRFLEIHRESVEAHEAGMAAEQAGEMAVAAEAEFANGALARLDWHPDAAPDSFDAPAVVGLGDGSSRRTDPDEPDGDLLRRIREACLETL
jgi:hypothetical protein